LIAATLMTADDVEQCLTGLPEQERPGDGWELARWLVQLGKLTDYQAHSNAHETTSPVS